MATPAPRNYTVTLARNGGKARLYLTSALHVSQALALAVQDWHTNCTDGVPNIATVHDFAGVIVTYQRGPDNKGWLIVPPKVLKEAQRSAPSIPRIRA